MQLKHHNAGFTMLEVLITMVILSIGLLGLAGMQANGLKSNHLAYMRSQATLLAYDMSDRMRANMAGVTAGNYNSIDTSTITGTQPDCEAGACVPANMALYDANTWKTNLAANLPSGQGKTAVAAGIYTITVMWDDDKDGTGTDCAGTAAANLKCFQVELQL